MWGPLSIQSIFQLFSKDQLIYGELKFGEVFFCGEDEFKSLIVQLIVLDIGFGIKMGCLEYGVLDDLFFTGLPVIKEAAISLCCNRC